MDKGLNCIFCGKNRVYCNIVWNLCIPSRYYRNMSKGKIRSKEVRDFGIDWNKASFFCADCGKYYGKDKE